MDFQQIKQRIFTFKEPRVEPEFVLAWDEPTEIDERTKKAASQTREQYDYETAILPSGAKLTGNLETDAGLIIKAFGGAENQSLGRRELWAGGSAIIIFFIRHLVNPQVLANNIIEPLNGLERYNLKKISSALTADWVESTANLEYGLEQLRQGKSLILIANEPKILLAETGPAAHRQVSQAINERVIKGPQEGFTEDLATNIALVQKRFRSHRLRIETMEAGSVSHTRLAILSVNGITNPRLVAEVKRRINGINLSHLTDSGMLEQLIEDNTWHLYPQILATERPDRIAAALDEGRVAVLVDGSHMALTMPITVIGLLHSPEDYSFRFPYAVYLRFTRILGAFLVLFLPAFYLAANLFQPELLPTDLLIALVTINQSGPLPTIVEVLLLEFIFDVLREAGFRGPRDMAAPLTIVVGILLSLTAAFTNIINPVLLVVIAVSGAAGFLMPEFSVSLSFRLTRYIYTLLAFIFGFIGIAFGAFIHLHLLAKQKSFGVPMLAPIGPFTRRSGDIILISPLSARDERPDFFDALRSKKKPKNPQAWKTEQSQHEKAPEVMQGGAKQDD